MRSAFKIPLQTEVEMYMKEKKGWPDNFVKYYAEKFWNHYQASGWKLSSGNRIKDWKACFNSQWQQPKFKEDIERLNGFKPQSFNMSNGTTIKEVRELDEILAIYTKHPTSVDFYSLGNYYEFMKREKLLKPLTQIQINDLREAFHNDNFKCRCACVQLTIQGYVDSGFTFAKVFELRQKIAK
jgi:hypothetical protein